VIVFSFFFFFKKKDMLPAIKENTVTEQQQISIVQELNAINKLNPVSDKEKVQLLKDLKTEVSKTKPLTNEEKAAILKSLMQ
jgi:hypothetical protein